MQIIIALRDFGKELKHIIIGWWNRLFNKNTDLAKKRLAICDTCENKKYLKSRVAYCSRCGCVLSSKTRVKDEKCLMGKWNE